MAVQSVPGLDRADQLSLSVSIRRWSLGRLETKSRHGASVCRLRGGFCGKTGLESCPLQRRGGAEAGAARISLIDFAFSTFFHLSFGKMRELPEKRGDSIRMAIISDTHNCHRSLLRMPEDADSVDILLHCGDATNRGCTAAWEDLDDWFAELPAQHKLMVPGNHDITLDDEACYHENRWRFHGEVQRAPYFRNITVLQNKGISCCGLNIYGFPQVPPHHDWAFGAHSAEMGRLLACVPENVDVLATHGPPSGSKRFVNFQLIF